MTSLADFPITQKWPAQDPSVIQLYSFPTPNGVKASIALEELGLPYEAHRVTLADADVKSPEFLSLNPNNKIPAIIDPNGADGEPIGLFESGAILLYRTGSPAISSRSRISRLHRGLVRLSSMARAMCWVGTITRTSSPIGTAFLNAPPYKKAASRPAATKPVATQACLTAQHKAMGSGLV